MNLSPALVSSNLHVRVLSRVCKMLSDILGPGCYTGHTLKFNEVPILAKSSSYNERLVRESLRIHLILDAINKED